ncbi:glycosyltransferase family 2 protein [Massilibacteroides sp.]|uniref:glycosyltransferase family 2 protein n=1 Tax=Massilibacteroides sp. TaxID=2034766 RepID=UPI00262E09CF|nr:glycosyltransferase family 2 protein [Massilibacteroides sp.]MDD4515369.1 glycosyltransferase family 2 protein [Massilibacteroides sp.]
MDVSIIYVNYKTAQLILDSIQSVKEKTDGITYEIIVVDNNSGDESLAKITAVYPEVIPVQSEENVGFGRANNLGIQIAKGHCFFFLNPDTLLINNAIKILYDFLNGSEHVGACGGNLYSIDNKPAISFSALFPSFLQEVLSIFYLPVTFFSKSKSEQFNYTGSPLDVASISGADLLLKREVLEKTGGFDPAFFMNYEETELCYRIKKQGYRIVSVPDAQIIHLEGKSDYASISRLTFYYQGQYIYFNKLYGKSGSNLIYAITQLKNRLRVLQFSILGDAKRKTYWQTKKETNSEVFRSFRKRNIQQ